MSDTEPEGVDDLGLGSLYRPLPPGRGGAQAARHRGTRRRRLVAAAVGGAAAVVVAAVLVVVLPGSHPQTVSVGDNATTTTTVVASSTTAAPTSSTTTSGAPACTEEALGVGLEAALTATSYQLAAYGCSGDFAFVEVNINPPASAAKGTPGISETLLFKVDGSTWAHVSQSSYCSDNAVPTTIYQQACASN